MGRGQGWWRRRVLLCIKVQVCVLLLNGRSALTLSDESGRCLRCGRGTRWCLLSPVSSVTSESACISCCVRMCGVAAGSVRWRASACQPTGGRPTHTVHGDGILFPEEEGWIGFWSAVAGGAGAAELWRCRRRVPCCFAGFLWLTDVWRRWGNLRRSIWLSF